MEEEKNCTSLVQSLSKAAMAVWAAVALLHIEGAQAKTPVSIELVFAVDTSMSIDGFEYDFLMKGIAKAFGTPEIINLIGQQNGVAVTLFQWSSEVDEQHMIPWHLLKDPASVLAFAAKVEKAERDPDRRFTGIGRAFERHWQSLSSKDRVQSRQRLQRYRQRKRVQSIPEFLPARLQCARAPRPPKQPLRLLKGTALATYNSFLLPLSAYKSDLGEIPTGRRMIMVARLIPRANTCHVGMAL